MDELDPELDKQIERILDASDHHPLRQFSELLRSLVEGKEPPDKGAFRQLAILYTRGLRKLPLCFWLQVQEAVDEHTNYITHNLDCVHWHSQEDTCDLGHAGGECTLGCDDYDSVPEHYCDEVECVLSCETHWKQILAGEGGEHA